MTERQALQPMQETPRAPPVLAPWFQLLEQVEAQPDAPQEAPQEAPQDAPQEAALVKARPEAAKPSSVQEGSPLRP